MNDVLKAKLSLLLSMVIFGTIGIFRRYIPLSSSLLALLRGIIGTIFLFIFVCITRQKINKKAIRKNIWMLIISGAAIGINWILLFEAYGYTSIATATLCYYMAPVIVILASPFIVNEKLSPLKILCTIIAFIGMIFVSGVFESGFNMHSDFIGVLYGLGAAILYGSVVLCNKKITDIGAYEKTIVQLGSSAIVLLPYTLLSEGIHIPLNSTIIIMLLIVGIVHTGIAYALYFGTTKYLNAQTLALYSYIDPIVAIVLSVTLLQEPLSTLEIIGAILILGATIVSDVKES